MRRITTATALAVLVAACSGSTAESAGDELSLRDFGVRAFEDNPDRRVLHLEVETKVAECMTAQGFDYIPYVESAVSGGLDFDRYGEEEYARTYGFGISTSYFPGGRQPRLDAAEDRPTDPNIAIADAMSDETRLEYDRALYGHSPPVVTADSDGMTIEELIEHNEVLENREMSGCYGEANRSVYPDEAFFEEFGDLLEAAAERAMADPRYVEAEERWSTCMAERGYGFASHEELFLYVYGPELDGMSGELLERVEEVLYGQGAQSEAPTGHEADFEGGVVETAPGADDLGRDASEEGAAPEFNMAKLQVLIDEEVSMAVADYECSEDLRRVWVELAEGEERDFIDENRDRLLEFQKRSR